MTVSGSRKKSRTQPVTSGVAFANDGHHFTATADLDVAAAARTATAPLSVILQVTKRCNFDCSFCSETLQLPDPSLDWCAVHLGTGRSQRHVLRGGPVGSGFGLAHRELRGNSGQRLPSHVEGRDIEAALRVSQGSGARQGEGGAMPTNWPGESERDRAVEKYAEALLLPGATGAERQGAQRPVTLLLGPRGSGKTTLLRHLDTWAQEVPRARLDVADLAEQAKTPIDVLSALAARLTQPGTQPSPLRSRSFDVARKALDAPTAGSSHNDAVKAVAAELAQPWNQWVGPVLQVAQIAASVAGLPAVVGYALQLVPLAERSQAWARMTLRLSRVQRGSVARASLDLLAALSRAYNEGLPDERCDAEQFVCRVLLDDLRRGYTRKDWAVRSLLLLDNVDNPLGDAVLRLLLDVREAAEPDPFIVLATAGSYPEALQGAQFGWHREAYAHPGRWRRGVSFLPEKITEGLRVGQLRDLTRAEVEQQVRDVRERAGAVPAPRREGGVRWLGWAVYELTRGQPEGTTQVLEALLDFDHAVPWERRLREIFEPSRGLADSLLDRLLPIGVQPDLRQALIRASVAPDLASAQVTPEIRDAGVFLQETFRTFCRDPLRTLHLDTGDEESDGRPEIPHPLLRRALWLALDDAPAVHALRRAECEERGKPRSAAYHALACGDLEAAATYLDGLFEHEQVNPTDWCAELAQLRRAPLPVSVLGIGVAREADSEPWRQYETLVRHLSDETVDPRLRTVTRLLAASWIAPEPPDAPGTDRTGDPWREPLGDPYAGLYPEINSRLHTLATAHTDSVVWTSTLLDKAVQYREVPWR